MSFVSFIVSAKKFPYFEFFKRLKERTDVIVAAQELCPLRILDSSHSGH